MNYDMDEYGHFIDIDNDIYTIRISQINERHRQFKEEPIEKIITVKENNISNEKYTNYESYKVALFGINMICCVTISILVLNLWNNCLKKITFQR
jgi:hypothetical protein